MATSQKLTDHFLTCTVCTEVFNDPCSLDCNHTFCRKCVVSFIKTQPDAVQAKSIPCPFCWKWMKSPNPNKPVEQWADDLKLLFVIQGLLDSFGPSSKDTTNCSYCKAKGETTPAIYWCSVCDDALCQTCILIHKQTPTTRNHHVDDLSSEVKVKRRRKVTCKEHPNEYVEFHCKKCKKAVCQRCCIIYHRKCKAVVAIESELEEMKAVLAKNREKMLKKVHETNEITEGQKAEVGKVVKNQSEIQNDIRSTCENMIKSIKKNESKLLQDLAEATERQTGQLRADIKTGEMAVQMYQQQAELIDQAVKSDCEMDVYEMYQSWESESWDRESGLKTNRVGKINWRKDVDELMKTLNQLHYGEIEVLYEGILDLDATPVLQEIIDVNVAGDSWESFPNDVTVLNVNGIHAVVVTDWRFSNKCLKAFYRINNKPHHSKLRLDGQPWSLTQVKHNQVAVTVSRPKQIVTVEVNPDMKLLSTIETSERYRGITALPGSMLAVTIHCSPSVDILDMSGNLIRSLSPQIDNRCVFTNSAYICTTQRGNILLSYECPKAVLCLTPEGDVVFEYTRPGLQGGARGIANTGSGDILVADVAPHGILHLTESGQFVRNILTPTDWASRPYGLHVDKQGRLYVCLADTRCIKVYACT